MNQHQSPEISLTKRAYSTRNALRRLLDDPVHADVQTIIVTDAVEEISRAVADEWLYQSTQRDCVIDLRDASDSVAQMVSLVATPREDVTGEFELRWDE